MSITVTNLSKYYGTQKAVNNISFAVAKGEVVGFLGPNGAGKSTTMKMITGYLAADSGNVKVCDIPVNENNLEAKSKIGYLPEANPLYMEMYVREYLSFIAGIHKIDYPKQKIEEVISTVGLNPEAHKKIGQLSKGYKQRVGLAAALVHEPEVLILDEPTSGLDPNQIIEIRNVIKTLAKEKTVLFSSHIMQEVEAICDRVIIINKGNIVADDRLSQLRSNNATQRGVSVTFKGGAKKDQLSKLSGISKITQLEPAGDDNASHYLLECADPEVVKKQLLQFSIEQNLDIISLQTTEQSLENVFRELTQPGIKKA